MRISVWTVTLFALSILLVSETKAQVPECARYGEPHPYGSITFITNSYPGQPTIPGYGKSARSCVTHNDPVNALYVHWLIPGPDGWIPPGKMLESMPRDTNVATFSKLKGCLLYGNRGDTTYGTFIGVEGDDKLIQDEKQRGCRAVVANPQPSPKGISNIIIKFLNYFPSDASKPKETMLQLDGSVEIVPKNSTSYESIVSYSITRYEGSYGSPTELAFRPIFNGSAEQLLGAFFSQNKEPGTLSEKGQIKFDVGDIKNPMLQYVAYQVLDRDRRTVGSIAFPLFVSGP
jgi:hypothetical protein